MTGLQSHCDIQICVRAAADQERAVYVYDTPLQCILHCYFCVTNIQIITEVLE